MELLYLYVEEYKIFRKREFKFNNKLIVLKKFDNEQNLIELEVEEKENYKFKYAKNINSVVGIVGMNGSGKSLLLELIEKIFEYIEDSDEEDDKYKNLKVAFIYKNNNKLFLDKINMNIKLEENNTEDRYYYFDEFKIFKNSKKEIKKEEKSIKILNFIETLVDNKKDWSSLLRDNFPEKIVVTEKLTEKKFFLNKDKWFELGEKYRWGSIENLLKKYEFEFGNTLSTGEEILFELFSEIKKFENEFFYQDGDEDNNVNRACYNLILLLDEPEISLHLEWQRRFFSNLLNKLSILYDVEIQIFIATHSPFILSDLLDEDIIFLNKENSNTKPQKTFGANIFDILKNDFFMTSFIGEYSKQEIRNIINLMEKNKEGKYLREKELEENEDRIKYLIDSIGEPLIKNKLKKMYDSYKEYKKNNRQKINSTDIEEIRKFIESKGILIDDLVNELK
ncbi:AAA family ATPase [Cetobacterium somerae]